ncbi:MAG: DeoR/GlpR family DNA-binding transcription regulator [Clostridiales bacterium]|jgi:DeoR family myo-inositol catabolism operon transcriptional repressor|nr:DeoR/GlpR family DNA-binding transcription regulator [Clostridiales bacterium]
MKFNRVKEIEKYILEHESATLDDLCQVFGISKNTIRRDVKLLADKGSVTKIYGGVAANDKNSLLSFFEERITKNAAEKERIGLAAAGFVEDQDVIFVDSGTTTFQMLPHLKEKKGVTVITNNLRALGVLLYMPSVNVIAMGGALIRKTSSFSGADTVATLQHYNITKCFMAATGVSIANGLTNSTMAEFELKKAVIQRSGQVILLADVSKFDQSSLMTYCPLAGVHRVITDRMPPESYVAFFQQNNTALTIA